MQIQADSKQVIFRAHMGLNPPLSIGIAQINLIKSPLLCQGKLLLLVRVKKMKKWIVNSSLTSLTTFFWMMMVLMRKNLPCRQYQRNLLKDLNHPFFYWSSLDKRLDLQQYRKRTNEKMIRTKIPLEKTSILWFLSWTAIRICLKWTLAILTCQYSSRKIA